MGLQMAVDGLGRILYLTPPTVWADTWQTALSILGIVVAATKLDGDPALPSRPLTRGRVCPPLQLTLQDPQGRDSRSRAVNACKLFADANDRKDLNKASPL